MVEPITSARRAAAPRSRRIRRSTPSRPRERLEPTMNEDERLLRRAEKALTEIKIAQGLSDAHASVLAALRMRLTGDPGKSLDEMLEAAGDLGGPQLDTLLQEDPA